MNVTDLFRSLQDHFPTRRRAAKRRRAIRRIEQLEDRTLLAAPNPFELSSLNGSNGFVINGIDAMDDSGRWVRSAGDVNGDGFDDVIISAPEGDPNGQSNAGESYVVFGQSGGFASSLNLSSLNGSNGFVINGIDATDYAGAVSVSGAGDVNGDGFDDLLIGAGGGDPNLFNNAGESYVIFGHSGAFAASLNLSSLNGSNGFTINGIDASDYSGGRVSGAGDVNGDGFDDLLISGSGGDPNGNNSGESYVVFGQAGPYAVTLELNSLNGSNGFIINGINAYDGSSGLHMSNAGDVNGDGFGDLLIGARSADPDGKSYAGETYVVFGDSGGFGPSLNLSMLNGNNGFVINGVDPNDNSGVSVSGAGDVNGDGFDDLLIGAHDADPNGNNQAGESYVVFGHSGHFSRSLDLSSLNGANGFVINGIDAGDTSGFHVSGAGDVNGDGFNDLIIGAFRGDPGGRMDAGESYIVFGHAGAFAASLDLSSLNGINGFVLNGIDDFDISGLSVSGAGDVNGDGFDDLLTGARLGDPNGVNGAGETFVVFGGNFTGGSETQVGDGNPNALTAMQGSGLDILIGGQGNDALVSDGGPDILRAGEGDDLLTIPDIDFTGTRRLVGGNGIDTLALDGTGLTFDLTSIADNRIVDIEQIDITGSGDNTLTLNQLEVLNLSSHSNTVIVRRDQGDTVNIGNGWTQQPDELIGPDTFEVFTQGAAVVKVQVTTALKTLTLTIDMNLISENGGSAPGTVMRNTGTTGDLTVNLLSDDTTEATVPSTVTILNGFDNATFIITAVDDLLVDGTQTLTITASATGFTDGTDTIDIADDDLPPVVGNIGNNNTYKEGRPAVLLAPNATVTDSDTPILNGGTIEAVISLNPQAGDTLSVIDFRDVTVSGNDVSVGGTSVGTISGIANGISIALNSNASVANVQAILNAIAFSNTLDNLLAGPREVSFTVSDGTGGTSTPVGKAVAVFADPDRPVIAALGGPVTFNEDAGPITLTSTGTLTDPDEHPDWSGSKLNVRVSRNPDSFDRLSIENQGTGAEQISANATEVFYEGTKIGNWNGGVGTNRLQINFVAGSTSVAIQALIRAIQFENLVALPIVASKDARFELTDPDNFANIVIPNAILTVNMQGTNDLPSLSGINATPTVYNEGGAPRTIGTGGIVTDDDYNGTGFLRVTIASAGETSDRLTILNQGNGVNQIGVTSNQLRYSGVLIGMIAGGVGTNPLQVNLNANATRAGVQAAMRLVQYSNVSDNPGTAQRQLDFLFNDGDGADSNVVSAFVNVNATNDAPVLNTFGSDVATATGTNVRVSTTFSVSDPDSPDFAGGLFRATISSGQQVGDTLSLFNDATISVVGSDVFYLGTNIGTLSTNATALTVLLNGSATATMVQRLGRNLELSATSAGTRTVSYQVLDGDGGNVSTPDKNVTVT